MDMENWSAFRAAHPDFNMPVKVEDPQAVEALRDALRAVWSNRDPGGRQLEVILGLQPCTAHLRARMDSLYHRGESLFREVGAIRDGVGPLFPMRPEWFYAQRREITESLKDIETQLRGISQAVHLPVWERGEFYYRPSNQFQVAVYSLWKQSWRAKKCLVCGKFFVAEKPTYKGCSARCRDTLRSSRNEAYWRAHKSQINARRARKPKRRGK